MIVISFVDILRAASAWRLMRALAAGLLALAFLAPPDAARAGHAGMAGISAATAVEASSRDTLAATLGQAHGPDFGMDDSVEDPFKLGRAVKAPAPRRAAEAPPLPADPCPDGLGAALPERPPRA